MEAPAQNRVQVFKNQSASGVKGVICDALSDNSGQYGSAQRESVLYVDWTLGTTAGAVIIEHAHASDYGGGWSPFGTFTWATENTEDSVQITGCMGAWRARITTTVVGGTGINIYALSN